MSDISAAIMLSSACGSEETGVVFYNAHKGRRIKATALRCSSPILRLLRMVVVLQDVLTLINVLRNTKGCRQGTPSFRYSRLRVDKNRLGHCTYNLEQILNTLLFLRNRDQLYNTFSFYLFIYLFEACTYLKL